MSLALTIKSLTAGHDQEDHMRTGPALYDQATNEVDRRNAVFQLMSAGWKLCVWRNSSPHNWFLEHQKTREQINLDRNDFDRSWVRKVRDSRGRVIQYWGLDSGMPLLTTYTLRKRPWSVKLTRNQGGGMIRHFGWFQTERIGASKRSPQIA